MSDADTPTVHIPTARGDVVRTSDLGRTLMHEHTFVLSPEINLTYPETFSDEEARIAAAIADFRTLKQSGIDTVVDVTVIGLGRYIPRVARIAREVDLNIIVATGIYTYHEIPHFFKFAGPGTMAGGPETVDDLFVRDIEEGIGESGVRAGILKVATDKYGVTEGVERVLRATASAHRRTGVPITTHTHDVPNGADQQRVLEREGVDLSRVIIGHVDLASSQDLEYVEGILAKGSYIGFDQWGVPVVSDEQRADAVAELCRRGHVERIVLSQDHCCYVDCLPEAMLREIPTWRKTFLVEEGLPLLRERGVTEEQITTMLVDNPRRIFESVGPY